MTNNYDIVWPYPVPPVCPERWNNSDWVTYIKRYRPAGYTGGETDTQAWADYQEEQRKAALARLLGGEQ